LKLLRLLFKNFFFLFNKNNMFDGKFLCTLAALFVTVIAICNITPPEKGRQNKVEEGFWMGPSRLARVERVQQNTRTGEMTTLKGRENTTLYNKNQEFFQVPPSFQSNLSPRFNNNGMTASLRHNMPSERYLGSPKTPLGYANVSRENYGCSSCGGNCSSPATCLKGGSAQKSCLKGAGGSAIPSDFRAGEKNYETLYELEENNHGNEVTDMIPVGDMTTLNKDGTTDDVIVFDRLIYANRNSRIRGQGDMIRGDLPIVPCKTGWFQVSANPSVDLQQGAMNVLGGFDSESQQNMASLISDYSGSNISGGVALTRNELSSIGQEDSMVNVTAFA